MKKIVLIGITFAFSLFAYSAHSKSTDEIFEKEYQESFKVNANASLLVENKYGDVYLTSWDKSEIKIDVIVKVEGQSSRSKASDLFKNIEIKISGDENSVKATTYIPSFKNTGNIQISIDYYVSLPETSKLDIYQKYGNIVLNNDWIGPTNLNLKYGNLQTRGLGNYDNVIEVKYGELTIENINASRIDIAYSDASIKSAAKLDLNTSYSDVELGVLGNLELKSAFDDIEIKEITDLYARTDYSDIEIDKLRNSIEIDLDFGDMAINHVAQGFKLIKIDSDNAGVEIEMDESAFYNFEVVTRYGDFYARNERSFSKEKLSFNSYMYTGTVGSSANKGEIIIDSSYASIEIK